MSKRADLCLDVSGTCCPVPLIRLATAVKSLTSGQTIEIVGNDPIFETAVLHFCQANNHALIDVVRGDSHSVRILIGVGDQ